MKLLGIELNKEQFDKLICDQNKGMELYVENGVVKSRWHEETEDEKLEALRGQRKYLLNAFDIWEKAVIREREEDSKEIMQWYQDLLDLNEDAFNNIPEQIKHYL